MINPEKIMKRIWQPTSGDYDPDSDTYDINYGECQICGKKLYDKKSRHTGLCPKCLKEEKENTIRIERKFQKNYEY